MSDLALEGFDLRLERLSGDDVFGTFACHLSHATGTKRESGLGKGAGPQSVASAIYEAIEHASCHGQLFETSTVTRVSRDAFVLDQDLRGTLQDYFDEASSDDPDIAVTEFCRLGTQSPADVVAIPSAYSDMSFRAAGLALTPHEKIAAAYVSSNGYAAGASVVEAQLHALNEILERDAFGSFLAACLIGDTQIEELFLDSSLELMALKNQLQDRHATNIRLGRLEAQAGHVFVASSAQFDSDGSLLIGLGSSPVARYAIERALLELDQELTSVRLGLDPAADGALPIRESLRHHPNLLRVALLSEDLPFSGAYRPPLEEASATPRQLLAAQIQACERLGLPLFHRAVWSSAGGATVVQLYAPWAERFHLVRMGYPVEPLGRRRSRETALAARAKQ